MSIELCGRGTSGKCVRVDGGRARAEKQHDCYYLHTSTFIYFLPLATSAQSDWRGKIFCEVFFRKASANLFITLPAGSKKLLCFCFLNSIHDGTLDQLASCGSGNFFAHSLKFSIAPVFFLFPFSFFLRCFVSPFRFFFLLSLPPPVPSITRWEV